MQYRALARNYDNAQRKYQEIRAKQTEAQLGQSLESERKGERFTLIEPPILPEKPVRPNRTAVLLLGVLLALAGGVGFAVVAETIDSSVRGARDMTAILQTSPLGVIPYIENDADVERRAKRRTLFWRGLAAACMSVFVAIVLMHFLIKPLDVVWFSMLRRLGV